MSNYTHLTASERDQIADLKSVGSGVQAIAAALGRSASTISRELQRNALDSGAYRPVPAEGAYLLRRQRPAKLERDNKLAVMCWPVYRRAGRLSRSADACARGSNGAWA